MPTKQDILEAIRETAKKNGGKPLGCNSFKKETGINPYDWGKYWARFGDAQKEAGFIPNTLQVPHSLEFLLESIITLMKEKGRFPTRRELIVKRNNDPKFPNVSSFQNRLGHKKELVKKVFEYAERKGYEDIVSLCQSTTASPGDDGSGLENGKVDLGEVYLFKSGRYFKIGKTKDTVRRGTELRIQLPEKCVLIHSIKTDDPSGVEAYWHRRFEAKRQNGEWFDLIPSEVRAFKRWRRIV